jgi:hypothetical protein
VAATAWTMSKVAACSGEGGSKWRMRAEAAEDEEGAEAGAAHALQATLDINASASGHAGEPAWPRRTSAAADSAPTKACRAALVLRRPACSSHKMRDERQGMGRWLMSKMKCSLLKPNRWRARVTAVRHAASDAGGSEPAAAAAASGGQGLEVRDGAGADGGTLVRRKTSTASLCMSNNSIELYLVVCGCKSRRKNVGGGVALDGSDTQEQFKNSIEFEIGNGTNFRTLEPRCCIKYGLCLRRK